MKQERVGSEAFACLLYRQKASVLADRDASLQSFSLESLYTDRQFSRVGASAYCQLWLIATCCHQPRVFV